MEKRHLRRQLTKRKKPEADMFDRDRQHTGVLVMKVHGRGMDNLIKRILTAFLCVVIVISATGCGGSSGAAENTESKAQATENQAQVAEDSGADVGVDEAQAADKEKEFGSPEKFKDAKYNSKKAEGNEEVQVDLSSVSKGYVALECKSEGKIKLQVFKDDETYTYDVVCGKPQIYPLQCGNGDYTFKVMKNIEGNKYAELYSCSAKVKLKDKFGPYLRPNQYADYNEKSKCVAEAKKFAEEAKTEQEFVDKVYEYVCKNVKYDYDEAKTVQSGYIPNPDEVLTSGKGICFDYASLAASMMRSQGIPTKIIFGYVAPDDLYHAWNMFYTEETGWTKVEIKVNEKDWSRIDLTFSANGEDGDFIGDGSNYMDAYQF